MTKHITTNFHSPEEAREAKQYLEDSGYGNIDMNLNHVTVNTDDENWIGAYEIANSLGGTFEEDASFPPDLDEHYHIEEQGEVLEDDEEIDMIDPDAYIDMNLGFGDYEIIEPYILHTYRKLVDDEE